MNAPGTLQQLVVEAVSNDYENVETILEQVMNWVPKDVNAGREEIVKALEQAISNGYVQSYLLSTREPQARAAEFSIDRLDELWFYVTLSGRQIIAASE